MKIVLQKKKIYVLKFEKGEKYPEKFIDFLQKKKICGGFFLGLGAGRDPEVAFYDLKKEKYLPKKFSGNFEVLNITGNVATLGKEIVIHQHISISNKDCKVIGGHLNKMIVGGTLEICLLPFRRLQRKKDAMTGLNLFVI